MATQGTNSGRRLSLVIAALFLLPVVVWATGFLPQHDAGRTALPSIDSGFAMLRLFAAQVPIIGAALSALLDFPTLIAAVATGWAISKFLPATWERLLGFLIAGRVVRWSETFSAGRLTEWLGHRFASAQSSLLRGDREGYARQCWPEHGDVGVNAWPTLYLDIPEDIRPAGSTRGLMWDGRLPGGHHVTWLAWRHLTPEIVVAYLRSAARVGARAGAVATLILLAAIAFNATGYHAPAPFPTWAGHFSIPAFAWTALVSMDFAARAAAGVALSFLAGFAFVVPAAVMAFWTGLIPWWDKACAALRTPTRDSLTTSMSSAREKASTASISWTA